MNSITHDPKGYYAVLGLAPGADYDSIRSAYRARVKAVHPDRNGSTRAKEEFQRLAEAYAVLRDVVRRAEYDGTGQSAEGVGEDDETIPAAPYACTGCGAVTAQPRYVRLHTVRSWVIWARTGRVEGIFCRDCADRKAAQASTATWAWGWWSLPGLLLTPVALIRNLLGGSRPRRENARLLIRQGRAFLADGELELARSAAAQAAEFATTETQRRQVDQLRKATTKAPGNRRLKDRWRLGGAVFMAQLMPLLALPLTMGMFVMIATRPWDQPISASASIAPAPTTIGEIRHVAIEDLKVRIAPTDGAPVLTLLDRFSTVEVTDPTENPEWVQVRTSASVTGYVPARALYAGSGSRFKREWCADNRGDIPAAGEVLVRRVSGDNRLLVHNDGRLDGVVKLKTLSGNTVMAFYVPATYHIGIGGIPEGTYRIEYGAGAGYSRGCGIFLEDMRAGILPVTLTFKRLSPTQARQQTRIPEISLAPPPGSTLQPQPIDPDKFATDD